MTQKGALEHPNVVRIQNYQASVARGDLDAARTVFEPDVAYVVPGDNALSGRYVGPDAVMGYFARLGEVSGGTYRIVEMNWLVCGDRVCLETRNEATVKGRSLAWDEAIVFEMPDGRKRRIDLYQADQAAVDALFGPRGA